VTRQCPSRNAAVAVVASAWIRGGDPRKFAGRVRPGGHKARSSWRRRGGVRAAPAARGLGTALLRTVVALQMAIAPLSPTASSWRLQHPPESG